MHEHAEREPIRVASSRYSAQRHMDAACGDTRLARLQRVECGIAAGGQGQRAERNCPAAGRRRNRTEALRPAASVTVTSTWPRARPRKGKARTASLRETSGGE